MKPRLCPAAGRCRQLDRQISTQFYERTALSRNKAAMLRKSGKPDAGAAVSHDEEIKDPFVLEFLGLNDEYFGVRFGGRSYLGGARPRDDEFGRKSGRKVLKQFISSLIPVIKEVEPRGFEPLTSAMPLRRSTN